MSSGPSNSAGLRVPGRWKLRTRILAATTTVLALSMLAAFAWSAINLRTVLEARDRQFLRQKLAELVSALREQKEDVSGRALMAELTRECQAHVESGLLAIVHQNQTASYFPDLEMTRKVGTALERLHLQSRQSELDFDLHVESDSNSSLGPTPAQYRILRSTVERVGSADWTIDLGMSTALTDAMLAQFYQRLALGGIVCLLAAFCGGLFLTRLSIRPLSTSIQTARNLNPDQLTARLELSGAQDELDQLASTINHLLDRVSQKHEQMVRFTSDASHELRGPLAALQAAIEISLQQPRSPDEYRELLVSLGEQCQRLGQLVNGLLLLARADAGQLVLQREPLDFAGLVHEIAELFQPLIDERQLSLELDLPDRCEVHGDRMRLQQLITNLLENAIKFSNPDGLLRMSVSSDYGQIKFRMTDTGVGIDPDRLPHIFDRFYRADESRSGGGTGLGLSICEWIVSAHGGTIKASSAPGKGTEVTCWLQSS